MIEIGSGMGHNSIGDARIGFNLLSGVGVDDDWIRLICIGLCGK